MLYDIALPCIGVFLLALPAILARPTSHSIDETLYLSIAQNIVAGQGIVDSFGELFAVHPPLLPLILGFVFKFTGFSIESATNVAKFFTWFNILMIYYLGTILVNRKVGWVSALIAASSPYVNSYTTRILLDNVASAFMLLSLVFLALGIKTKKFDIYILSGVALGLGFLTKETAILWLPLPLIAAFLLREGRGGVVGSIKFYISFGATIIWWWIYFYTQTGLIYLMHRAGRDFSHLLIPLVILVVVVLTSGLILRYYFIGRKVEHIDIKLSTLKLNASTLGIIIGIVLLSFSLVILTIAMMNLGIPIRNLSDFMRRFLLAIRYVREQILVQEPWQVYALWGWLTVILLGMFRWHPSERLLTLALILYFPFLYLVGVPTNKEFPVRNFQTLIWVSYLVLGYFIIHGLAVLRLLAGRVERQIPNFLTFIVIIALIAVRADTAYDFWVSNRNLDYLNSNGAINYSILDISEWLNDNIPQDAKIMTSSLYSHTLYLFDKRDTQLFKLPVKRIENQDLGLITDNIFIDKNVSGYSYNYTIISSNELLTAIYENGIDYLVISTYKAGTGAHLSSLPTYFRDNPVFRMVYTNDWKEFNYYVFKIDKAGMRPDENFRYPVSIDVDTANLWINQSKDLGYLERAKHLLNSLDNRPILLLNDTSPDFLTYRELARILATSNVNVAAFEVYQAFKISKQFINQDLTLAKTWSEQHPDTCGPWALMGAIYQHQGRIEEAKNAYSKSISVSETQPEMLALAYRGLGLISFEEGNYDGAVSFYQSALDISPFDAQDTRKLLYFTQAHLYQAARNLDQALVAYKEYLALEFDSIDIKTPFDKEPIYFDFVRQLSNAQINSIDNQKIYPGVTNIEDQLIEFIYAHPNSEIKYQLALPANAHLDFVPYFSPQVWQYGKGDGVQFRIGLTNEEDRQYIIFDEYWDPKNLINHRDMNTRSIDLSRWADQNVAITFSIGCGPNNDCRYDWAGWGGPRITQPVSFDFLDNFSEVNIPTFNTEIGQVEVITQTINYDTRMILYQHPTSRVVYSVDLPERAVLQFGLGMSQETWGAEKGDGAEYNLYVRDPDAPGVLHRVYHRVVDPKNNPEDRRWFDERLDLSRFGGHTVEIIFEALPGPRDNFDFDWGGWSDPILVNSSTLSPNLEGELQ